MVQSTVVLAESAFVAADNACELNCQAELPDEVSSMLLLLAWQNYKVHGEYAYCIRDCQSQHNLDHPLPKRMANVNIIICIRACLHDSVF